MASAAITPVLPYDVLCILMEFLDIRTLKAASLVNHDFKCLADRLIWQSFSIYVYADLLDVATCDKELHRIEEGCGIAGARARAKWIRKFTLTFGEYDWEEEDVPTEFERSILEMVFATLRLLTGLRQLELDLGGASSCGCIDRLLSRGPFPFQLEHFALTKPSYDEMEFLPEFLLSQKSITSLFINWPGPPYRTIAAPPRPRPLRVLDSGEWHLVKNRPITHLFAALINPDEVFDLFGSLSQSTTTLQLLWLRAPPSSPPSSPPSDAFFQFAADPIAATVVSNPRYLVLDTFRGGNIRVLSLFTNLEELVMNFQALSVDSRAIENDFLESSKSCPRLRKAVLLFDFDRTYFHFARFYRRMGVEEDWELMREDIGQTRPLAGRRHRFPAMPY